MKPLLSLGIAGLILLTSTGLHAQSEDRLEAVGYRLEGAERTLSDNIVANCDNSDPDLNCHLMMNPSMVEETEDAIERFIVGKTQPARKYSVNPSETCDRESTDQQNDLSNIDQHINQPITYSLQPTASIRPAGRIVTINPSVECTPTNHQNYSNRVYNNPELQSSNSPLPSPPETAASTASILVKADPTSEENIGTFSKLAGYFSKAAELLTKTADSPYLCPPEAVNDCAASEIDDSQQVELGEEAVAEEELASQELKTSTKASTLADHLNDGKVTRKSEGSSYIKRAAKAIVSYLASSSMAQSGEFNSWMPHASTQSLLTTLSSPSVLGLGALLSMLPHAYAANESFVVYSGLSTEFITPYSMTTNPDGSYIMGGYVYNQPDNDITSLLGKLDTNGKKEWFYEQSIPNSLVFVDSTTIMNNELFSAGSLYNNSNRQSYGIYISRNNLTSGIPLSAWIIDRNSINIIPTSRNTLIAVSNVVLFEFDPYNGVVLSAAQFIGDFNANSIAAIDDHSYIIGGGCGGSPSTKACLSKIGLTGTTWSSAWTRFYSVPSVREMFINSVAVRNNTAIFSCYVDGTTGCIGSVDATTGANHWVTSIEGTSSGNLNTVVFASSNSGNTNQIMAVGNIAPFGNGWYVLMNLNNGTLSKSVKLSGANTIYFVVANDDGSFTSLGNSGNGQLLFVTLNKNLEIDPSIVPPGMSLSDNSNDIVLGAQNITSTASSSTLSPVSPSSLPVTDITSQFSVVDDPITQTFPGQPTFQPTTQPTTAQPTTAQPTTAQPTTAQPTTAQPTQQPTTAQPTTAQPTKQPTQTPTLAPRNPAFVVYSTGNSTDQMYPLSLTANTDGSYIMGGLVFLQNKTNLLGENSLLGKFDANGQKEWFYEQSNSQSSGHIYSTTIMNNELFSGEFFGHISRHNLTSGVLLSAWQTGMIIGSMLPTNRNTLIGIGYYGSFEFDPYNGVMLSAAQFDDSDYHAIAAIDDHSYIIGGSVENQDKACLSKISLTGTTWSSAWTRFYSVPNVNNININSVAVRNNIVIFAGTIYDNADRFIADDGFIGSIDATTGATHWVTSIRGTSGNSFTSGDSLNTVVFANGNTNQIMAVGGSSYLLMNLNDGTLSKSVTLQSADILSVVANDDGTFTSLGMGGYCGKYNLLFVTLNKNLEIDPSLLSPGARFHDNSHNIVLGAQNIISTASGLTLSPISLGATDVTSRFSVVNNSITQTCPPNSDSDDASKNSDSTYIIAGGSAGAALITSALMCAFRKRLAAYCSKKYSSLSSMPNSTAPGGDIEQQLQQQSHGVIELPAAKFQSYALLHSDDNISHDIESNWLIIGNNPSKEAVDPENVSIGFSTDSEFSFSDDLDFSSTYRKKTKFLY